MAGPKPMVWSTNRESENRDHRHHQNDSKDFLKKEATTSQPCSPRGPGNHSFGVLEWKRSGCMSRNLHVALSSHWPSSVGGEGGGGLHPTGCTGDGHGMKTRLRIQTPITKVGRPFEREGGARPVARSWGFVAFFRPGRGRRWALGVGGGPGRWGRVGVSAESGFGSIANQTRCPHILTSRGVITEPGRIHWYASVARKPGHQ